LIGITQKSFRPLIGVIISKHEELLFRGWTFPASFRPLIGVIISKRIHEFKKKDQEEVSVPLSGLLFLNLRRNSGFEDNVIVRFRPLIGVIISKLSDSNKSVKCPNVSVPLSGLLFLNQ